MNLKNLMGATALAGSLALAMPAWAQTTEQPDPAAQQPVTPSEQDAVPTAGGVAGEPVQTSPQDSGGGREIVVTGSRISRPNINSAVPITSVTGEELQQTGRVSIGDVLNDLPNLQNTFSQQNSTRFLGTAGLNLIDLYALGTVRTLVLQNGRRHVGADILNNATSVDINTIPTDLIERVDIVTGGQSAVYGSDAIAGVVNFVLKDNYEGLALHGQGGISEEGDAGSYYGSILAGKNFADGRGNIVLNAEYARQNQFVASDRAAYRQNNNFVVVDTDAAGIAAGQSLPGFDGQPDRVFYRDIRPVTFSNNGTILFNGRTGPNAGRFGRDATNAAFDGAFIFRPDGTLVPQTGTRVGLSPNGSIIGGNGDTIREGDLVQLLPQQDRYSVNVLGHFDVTDWLTPFFEAKYVRTEVFGTGGSGPAFFQGGTLGDGFAFEAGGRNREQIRLDNPFLSAQARGVIVQQLALSNPTAAITDATQVALRRNLLDLGVRAEASRRETYRIVGGIRGTALDDWRYELSVNYGEFKERTRVQGNLNVQRFLLAIDSTRNAAGQIVCRAQIDPTAAYGYVDGYTGPLIAGDVSACQPLNPFGNGAISQAARNYVLQDTTSEGKITQFDVSGFVAGDTSEFFNLPGGPIGFSLGGEYRRETNSFQADPLVEQGYTFYNALTPFDPPAFEVKEAYAEVRLPLLANLPLIEELSINAAGRAANYKGSVGTVYAYNGSVEYSPIRDIRFRANYSRSVRAPNLSELYSAQGQNFAPGFVDPCAARQIGTGSDTRAANCAAQGIPANFDYIYQSSLQILSGGNPDLREEDSDSYTYGVVIQPSFAPGLSLSVDYYNIKVNNVITAPTAQQIANSCYDLSDLDNPFCSLFQRVPAGGAGPIGEEPFRIVEGSLQQTLLNYAKLQTRGIQTQLNYSKSIGADSRIGARVYYLHYLQNDTFLDPTDAGRANTILTELGTPKDQFNVSLDLKTGPLFVNYQLRYLSKQAVTVAEDLNSFQGRAPQNADYADILYYPDVTYHNIRFGLTINDQSSFYMGVDNFTDRLPPLGTTGIGAGSGIFDNVGRKFYAGINVGF